MAKPLLSRYIHPEALARAQHHRFMPKQLVEGNLAGAHKSPFHGFAVEFAGHREYVPGDDLRHLDWKVYYRHEKHVIKQYEMETNLVCHLLLDISASMRYGEGDQQKMLYASQLATTLGYLVVEQSDKVSFSTFDDKTRQVLNPSNAMAQMLRITETLDQVQPVHRTSLTGPLLEFAGRAGRRGIVIVLSDFLVDLDELDASLQRLRYDKHEVVLVQVMHHDELHFDLPGMVRFVGLEDADQYLTRPQDIREAYLAALRRHNDRLAALCDANQCEHLLCDTRRNLAELFADYLQQRADSGRLRRFG